MTDSTVQPTPEATTPAWSQAMQGKGGNAKRTAVSKRVFIVMSLTFFGCLLWLYIIYNLSHSTAKTGGSEAPITSASAITAPPPAAQLMTAPAATGPAFSRFGTPRQLDATAYTPPAAVSGASPYGILTPSQQPLQPGMMPANATTMLPPPAAAGMPAQAPVPIYGAAGYGHRRDSTLAISAPREYRHALGVAPQAAAGGGLAAPAARQRVFVAR